MKKDDIIALIFAVIVSIALFGTIFYFMEQETKTIEGEVVDVEILSAGLSTYWKIYFKDGTIIEARPNRYGGNTYDFVKNSRVLINFTKCKNVPGYWTIESVIKLPDLGDEQ